MTYHPSRSDGVFIALLAPMLVVGVTAAVGFLL